MMVDTGGDPRFSRALPGLQLQVNSSSLGPFKTCPRKYYYEVIAGLEAGDRSIHLTFGTLIHAGLGAYEILRAKGVSHEEALEETISWALRKTWDERLKRPWISGHPAKNRLSLVRALVWYLDQYGQNDSGPSTITLPDGRLAVEIDFSFNSGFIAESTGEEVSFIGRLDRIVSVGGYNFVLDTKTTEYAVDSYWIAKFTPDNQFSLYSLAGTIVLEKPIAGLMVDGMQVGVNFVRCNRGLVPRPVSNLDEWLRDSHFWLRQMEACAVDEYWPQNDRGCGMFGGCAFRQICGASPSQRERLLQVSYRKKQPAGSEDIL